MNKLTFALLLLSSIVCSQNYSPLNLAQQSRFAYNNNGKMDIAAISIDSILTNLGDTLFYNYRIVEDPYVNPGCIDSISRNFFADRILKQQNGSSVFFNSNIDSIHLYTNATLNSTWHLFELGSGSYLEAKVSAINYLPILGSTDSIKQIGIQAKDASNNSISHPFNSKLIEVGKNSGLVRFYNTLNFPNDTTTYSLIGKSNPEIGVPNLGEFLIFDFNPGDVFQYNGSYNAAPNSAMYDFEEFKILSKYTSANNDTIRYQKEHQYYRKDYQFAPFDSTISYTHDTVTETIILSDGNELNSLPYKFINKGFGNTGFLKQSINSIYNARTTKTIDPSYYISPSDSCLTLNVGWCIYGVYTYAEGLGFVSRYESNSNCYNKNLVYYSKGTESFGTPLNWNAIISVPENKFNTDKPILYPNPGKDVISFANIKCTEFNYELRDLEGRLIESGRTDKSIDVSEITNGCYFIRINCGGQESTFRFIRY